MSIDHVLAVVPVTDIERSHEWYVRLLGREPDNHPMPTLIEWRVVDRGWVQVTLDAARAGSALLNLAVDDLSTHVAQLAGRGLEPGEIVSANKGVRLCSIDDPDRNLVTMIGGFRERY